MRRSTFSRLTALFREAEDTRREAQATGLPISEITARRAERLARRASSRRDFLRKTLAVSASATLGAALPGAAFGATPKRIVIVGGGLAGLRCAHKLWIDRGIRSTVYEWDDHVGGRCQTVRGAFDSDQLIEAHGEFISSEHQSMLALAARYSLSLDNCNATPPHTQDTYWLLGNRYSQAQLNQDWQAFGWKLFNDAIRAAPWRQSYLRHTAAGVAYDHLSVIDWINQHVPGGMDSPFGKLCAADVESEFGSPASEQSALNLIYVLGYDDSAAGQHLQPRLSPVLAGTNEKYHVKGGNDQIIAGMVSELPAGTIQLSEQLVALARNGDHSYRCTFNNGSSNHDVIADAVVLAVPFSTLRQVDLSNAGLSPLKQIAIEQLGYGSNGKVFLQFNDRPWTTTGYDGNSLTDTVNAGTWDVSSYQPGPQGLIVSFPGGSEGAGLAARYGIASPNDLGAAPPQMVADFLAGLEQLFPGCSSSYNGKSYYSIGTVDPHIQGAWSNYLVGQYTLFSGIEPVTEGGIHFAGEHTSLNFQGFMEGAVRSGERAAAEL